MNFNEFLTSLKGVEDQVKAKTSSVFSALDRMTFGMMINCLKSEDPTAVKTAIDQLVSEKRPVAIPPLYLVSVAHPNEWVRKQAADGLSKIIPPEELKKLVDGKDSKEACKTLIEKYGHFKA